MGEGTRRIVTSRGSVVESACWSAAEVRQGLESSLAVFRGRLPTDLDARIVIKPNLNNDLCGLTGNSTDLRVLCALLEALRDRGYRDLTIADGANVGVARRGIDVFKRLRLRGLQTRYGVRLVDLNTDRGEPVLLHAGAHPRVARTVLDADFLISAPTVKTHAEAGLSSACKNWVGIVCGQDKREMHRALGRNIATLIQVVPPDLIVVDGLVGMEGNGPGDGDPTRLGSLLVADDPWVSDLAVARRVGIPWRDVPYLAEGARDGCFSEKDVQMIATMPIAKQITRPPPRSALAVLSERRELHWLKLAVRPVVSRPEVSALAYRAGVIQDVYSLEDDTITDLERDDTKCGTCTRCVDFCPTSLPLEAIGHTTDPEACISCLYCWWACPNDALSVTGESNGLERQITRYKSAIEGL